MSEAELLAAADAWRQLCSCDCEHCRALAPLLPHDPITRAQGGETDDDQS